jgi:hypothetical protein
VKIKRKAAVATPRTFGTPSRRKKSNGKIRREANYGTFIRPKTLPLTFSGGAEMSIGTILLIILILILIGALPRWGYSRGWGYGSSGILGVVVVVLLVLALMGRL